MTTLVIGASGLVGYEFYRQKKEKKDWFFTYNTHKIDNFAHLDATDPAETENTMKKISPKVVIIPAALPNVNLCETDKDLAKKINLGIVENVLRFIPKDCKIIFFSTDYIFDGKNGPYSEEDEPNPINYYGKLKLECEDMIKKSGHEYIIIRTTGIFGWELGRKNFFYKVFDTLETGKELCIPNDQFGNPTYVKDMISAVTTLIEKKCAGIYNVVGPECISRYEFAKRIADYFSLNKNLIAGKPTSYFKDNAPRPLRAGLKSDKITKIGIKLRTAEEAFLNMKQRKDIDNVY